MIPELHVEDPEEVDRILDESMGPKVWLVTRKDRTPEVVRADSLEVRDVNYVFVSQGEPVLAYRVGEVNHAEQAEIVALEDGLVVRATRRCLGETPKRRGRKGQGVT